MVTVCAISINRENNNNNKTTSTKQHQQNNINKTTFTKQHQQNNITKQHQQNNITKQLHIMDNFTFGHNVFKSQSASAGNTSVCGKGLKKQVNCP